MRTSFAPTDANSDGKRHYVGFAVWGARTVELKDADIVGVDGLIMVDNGFLGVASGMVMVNDGS